GRALVVKKTSKTASLQSSLRRPPPQHNIHIGPSDHVPWLEDRKWAQIRLEGKSFGDVPLQAELKLEVWDSPNSAGIVIDAVRCAKLALNQGVAGQLDGPSSYFMKSPYTQRPDDEAREATEEFIAHHTRAREAARRARAPRPPRRGPRALALTRPRAGIAPPHPRGRPVRPGRRRVRARRRRAAAARAGPPGHAAGPAAGRRADDRGRPHARDARLRARA